MVEYDFVNEVIIFTFKIIKKKKHDIIIYRSLMIRKIVYAEFSKLFRNGK